MTRALSRDVAEEVRNNSLREVVRFQPVVDGEPLQFGYEAPVPADDATHQPFMAKVVEPTFFPVSLACSVNEGEISRLFARRNVFRQILRLQRHRNFLCKTDADETAGRDRVAVANETHRFLGGDNLSSVGGPNLCELRLSGGNS